jgi:hypothetical protein
MHSQSNLKRGREMTARGSERRSRILAHHVYTRFHYGPANEDVTGSCTARTPLAIRMESEEFKKMRWVKLARKKGIPYFDDLPTLDPVPIESIECKPVKMCQLNSDPWEDPDIRKDRLLLAKEWDESYVWDYSTRKVAVSWYSIRKNGGINPRLLKQVWNDAICEEITGPLLNEIKGDAVDKMIVWGHRQEWDSCIVGNLQKFRRGDRAFDYSVACLVYHNTEITRKERERRFDTLDQLAVDMAIRDCNAWRAAPKQEGWHRRREPKALTDEMWHSICDNWWDKVEALQDIRAIHLEKRRQAFQPFYALERSCWEGRSKTSFSTTGFRRKHMVAWKKREFGSLIKRRWLG